eukprot:1431137-Prymnesium_polylepis.1
MRSGWPRVVCFVDCHGCPLQRGEQRPRYNGEREDCHKYHPELSGPSVMPDNQNPSCPAISISLHPVGGAPLLQPAIDPLQKGRTTQPFAAAASLFSTRCSARRPAGFCAVSDVLPLAPNAEVEISVPPEQNGMRASFGDT